MIKGAIFDFDGTLFDSMYVWKDVAATYIRSRGKEPKPGLRDIVKRQSLDQSSLYVKNEYELEEDSTVVKAGFNSIVAKRYADEVLPKDGVPEFLEALKKEGVVMCLATATDKVHIEGALKRCGLDKYFSKIITCTEVGHSKSEPDIFRAALEHLGTDRSNTMVFEDVHHAMKTVKDDGFLVVGVYDSDEEYPELVKELADVFIQDYHNLEDFWKFASRL